jgi:hypothetical protein
MWTEFFPAMYADGGRRLKKNREHGFPVLLLLMGNKIK